MTARGPQRGAAIAVAAVAAILYTLLGVAVSHTPPGPFDLAAQPLAGIGVPVAWIFTASCLWPVLVTYGVLALLLAAFSPAWRTRALFSVVLTILTWQTSDALKNLFKRPRPAYWVFHHETTFSYSSGHAMFALIVYGVWAYFVYRSALPAGVRFLVAALLVAWGLAVIWSRLALGAHYPTDLIGGLVLGIFAVAIGVFVQPRIVDVPSAGKSLGTGAARKSL
jgi:undecaprenyl-diphosphatase